MIKVIISTLKGPNGFGGIRLENGDNSLTEEQWEAVQSDAFAKPHIESNAIYEFSHKAAEKEEEKEVPSDVKELKAQLKVEKTKATKFENANAKQAEQIKDQLNEIKELKGEVDQLTSDLDKATA